MLEKVAYGVFGAISLAWLGAIVFGLIVIMPWGIVGLLGLGAILVLLIKVLRERLNNKEDDYYADNVDQ